MISHQSLLLSTTVLNDDMVNKNSLEEEVKLNDRMGYYHNYDWLCYLDNFVVLSIYI